MDIAQTLGKDFKIASIRIRPEDDPLVREFPCCTVWTDAVEAYVTHGPINPAIRPHSQSGHVVAAKADMDAIAVGNGFLLIHNPVAVIVLHPPKVRPDRYK